MTKLRVISGGKNKSVRQERNTRILGEANIVVKRKELPRGAKFLELEYKYEITAEQAAELTTFIPKTFQLTRQFQRYYHDHYFILTGVHKADHFARFRQHTQNLNAINELTVKRFEVAHAAICQEVNLKLGHNSGALMQEFMQLMDYQRVLTLRKASLIYDAGDSIITIDRVNNKRYFVEIEAKAPANVTEGLKVIDTVEERFKGTCGIQASNRELKCMFELFSQIPLTRQR